MWTDSPEGWEDFRDVVVYPAAAVAAAVAAVALTVHAITYREVSPTDTPPSLTPDCRVELPTLPVAPSAPIPPEGGLEVTSIPISIESAGSEQAALIPLPPQVAGIRVYMPQC